MKRESSSWPSRTGLESTHAATEVPVVRDATEAEGDTLIVTQAASRTTPRRESEREAQQPLRSYRGAFDGRSGAVAWYPASR